LNRISELLDDRAGVSGFLLALIALGLGAAHAVQPGHGKTLVTAVALSPDARVYQAVLLGLATTLAHMGSVLLVAVGLWYTGATAVGGLHRGLSHVAGFVIAAAGLWRVGRHLGGYGEHAPEEFHRIKMSNVGVVGLGLASGLVPCWDAVGLLVLAAALGRLATGVALVLAFSGGIAAVLVGVAWLAGKMKSATIGLNHSAIWQRRLGLTCGVMLAAIGLYLFLE
jgi:ABC-type nickel/cobalt efflux system permease component RcnA